MLTHLKNIALTLLLVTFFSIGPSLDARAQGGGIQVIAYLDDDTPVYALSIDQTDPESEWIQHHISNTVIDSIHTDYLIALLSPLTQAKIDQYQLYCERFCQVKEGWIVGVAPGASLMHGIRSNLLMAQRRANENVALAQVRGFPKALVRAQAEVQIVTQALKEIDLAFEKYGLLGPNH